MRIRNFTGKDLLIGDKLYVSEGDIKLNEVIVAGPSIEGIPVRFRWIQTLKLPEEELGVMLIVRPEIAMKCMERNDLLFVPGHPEKVTSLMKNFPIF